ncbi:MAG: integrase core domain-containing protein [Acidimicrobiaceae bacterium]|nr:integrase core domain-containing protein [Acidimicrobiaceae bacterium]
MIERFFEALKYEHLHRTDTADGIELAAQARSHRTTHNQIRPHEAIDTTRPPHRYRQTPTTKPPHQKSAPNP